jgi:hypothetical protein
MILSKLCPAIVYGAFFFLLRVSFRLTRTLYSVAHPGFGYILVHISTELACLFHFTDDFDVRYIATVLHKLKEGAVTAAGVYSRGDIGFGGQDSYRERP